MPPAGFEPAIPASEQPQTHALDRETTGIGWFHYSARGIYSFFSLKLLRNKMKTNNHKRICKRKF
jgi:hypothetical protein